jgi:leucyl aminopeptidase
MKEKLTNSGEETDEKVWELPIYEEHREMMKSKFADMTNNGGRYGGAITGAVFLENFIEKNIKWIHLDIAGAARSRKVENYIPEFGTGRGVRLLVEYLRK